MSKNNFQKIIKFKNNDEEYIVEKENNKYYICHDTQFHKKNSNIILEKKPLNIYEDKSNNNVLVENIPIDEIE